GGTVTKMFGPDRRWGVAVSARLGTKGMKTKASVKNYGMEMLSDGNILSGRWTGRVQTKYHTQQLSVPVLARLRVHNRTSLTFGPYLAYAYQNEFDGYVYDGYLREGDPTGDKYVFEGDSRASYDFGDELRKFQWGLQAGVTWMAYSHLAVNANLSWGLNDIFVSSFKTVTFNMYPIYLNVGFGYLF
ncbi:MAG: PorT family protein, partial [Paramuribaculum sp.]|nr:PorT family protein [Paramuribaculum sp.]